MRKYVGGLGRAALGIVIAAALAFGARQALAASAMGTCEYDPPTHLGECTSQMHCEELCEPYEPIQFNCFQGCCYCAVR